MSFESQKQPNAKLTELAIENHTPGWQDTRGLDEYEVEQFLYKRKVEKKQKKAAKRQQKLNTVATESVTEPRYVEDMRGIDVESYTRQLVELEQKARKAGYDLSTDTRYSDLKDSLQKLAAASRRSLDYESDEKIREHLEEAKVAQIEQYQTKVETALNAITTAIVIHKEDFRTAFGDDMAELRDMMEGPEIPKPKEEVAPDAVKKSGWWDKNFRDRQTDIDNSLKQPEEPEVLGAGSKEAGVGTLPKVVVDKQSSAPEASYAGSRSDFTEPDPELLEADWELAGNKEKQEPTQLTPDMRVDIPVSLEVSENAERVASKYANHLKLLLEAEGKRQWFEKSATSGRLDQKDITEWLAESEKNFHSIREQLLQAGENEKVRALDAKVNPYLSRLRWGQMVVEAGAGVDDKTKKRSHALATLFRSSILSAPIVFLSASTLNKDAADVRIAPDSKPTITSTLDSMSNDGKTINYAIDTAPAITTEAETSPPQAQAELNQPTVDEIALAITTETSPLQSHIVETEDNSTDSDLDTYPTITTKPAVSPPQVKSGLKTPTLNETPHSIPAIEPLPSAGFTQSENDKFYSELYIVKKGDELGKIALNQLPQLFEGLANNDKNKLLWTAISRLKSDRQTMKKMGITSLDTDLIFANQDTLNLSLLEQEIRTARQSLFPDRQTPETNSSTDAEVESNSPTQLVAETNTDTITTEVLPEIPEPTLEDLHRFIDSIQGPVDRGSTFLGNMFGIKLPGIDAFDVLTKAGLTIGDLSRIVRLPDEEKKAALRDLERIPIKTFNAWAKVFADQKSTGLFEDTMKLDEAIKRLYVLQQSQRIQQ